MKRTTAWDKMAFLAILLMSGTALGVAADVVKPPPGQAVGAEYRLGPEDVIGMAGGFTDLARPNKVIVLRNTPAGPQRIRINIKQLVEDDRGAPFYLQQMDTVYVE